MTRIRQFLLMGLSAICLTSLTLGCTQMTKGSEDKSASIPDSESMTESGSIFDRAAKLSPPIAPLRPKTLTEHGHTRIDDYYGLRDDTRSDDVIIDYLNAENDYTEAVMKPTEALQATLFDEMRGRIKEQDASVPYEDGGYWYYRRFEAGKEYPIYARRKGNMEAEEEILLDANKRAEGLDYYATNNRAASPNHKLYAIAEDTVSRRLYTIRIKNIADGHFYSAEIENTSGGMAWSKDSQYLFYVKKDEQTLLPYQVYRHKLGTKVEDDVLVYEEKDNTFYTYIYTSKNNDYIYVAIESTLTSEVLVLNANEPTTDFKAFLPRERGHEYSVIDVDQEFYVRTNWQAENFRIMKTTLANSDNKSLWKEVVSHNKDVFVDDYEVFSNYLVLNERSDGLLKIKVLSLESGKSFYIEPENDPAYVSSIYYNSSSHTSKLRYLYSSMTTPDSVYEYDMATGERQTLKVKEVLGPFDANNYQSERLWVSARDGVKVPVSLVYRKGFKRDGSHPLYQYAYGSYGSSSEPDFDSNIISMLDRGFVFAIAHIRGGQEMGRQWYEDGKLFNKINTYTDFIDVTKYLVKEKYAHKDKVFAVGGSAGGLLMGAVINMEGSLYRGVCAAVPFVDVVTTMLDESIPLTTGEYDEWGNPNEKDYYDYMLSYSPYDQVSRQSYPHMLVTSGLHDSQVQYWEPTKWVAKLRKMKTDNHLLLLDTNMEAGHGGASGRFRRLKEKALLYAFFLQLAKGDA